MSLARKHWRTTTRLAGILLLWGAMRPAFPTDPLMPHLKQVALAQLAERKQRVRSITSREEFEKRRSEVRRKLLAMMGGLPDTRGPLNIRKTGAIDRGDYRIEKIIFESQPTVYVTANLYVPQTGRPPYPAVIQPTGHSVMAKARAFYQTLGLGLVKQGFVVLTYDPTGQGERRIFWDADLRDSKVGGTTTEHSMVGIQSLLAGESIARYMVWDGMRGVDVLQSLPFVDGKRIGVSGCSGGGTLTAYLAALDDRLQVAAPSCYITDWEDQLIETGPQDAEQQFPGLLEAGLNHADLVQAFAPKPYLICSTEADYFPITGSRKTFEESRRIYSLFGAAGRIATAYDEGPHGTTRKQREAIYAWMARWLKGGSGEIVPEPSYQTEYEEDLLCTSTGQVATSLGGDTVSTLNMRRYGAILPPRPALASGAMADRMVERVRNEIRRVTRYEAAAGSLDLVADAPVVEGPFRRTKLTYTAAAARRVTAMLFEPANGSATARPVLFLVDGKPPTAEIDDLVGSGHAVLAVALSGLEEMRPDGSGYSGRWFGNEKLAWLAMMVGKPLPGMRIEDTLRAIEVLEKRRLMPHGECIGYARGAAPVLDLLHAAVLDRRIASVTAEGGLLSFSSMARTAIHYRLLESVAPGVLHHYDLPDLVAAVAPRPVTLANLRWPAGAAATLRDSAREYAYAESAYRTRKAAEQMQLRIRRENESLSAAYPELR
jgi:dienelactone hydrolase